MWLDGDTKLGLCFGCGDKFFKQFKEVDKLFGMFAGLMAQESYVANLQFVLHEIEDNEKKDMLCRHSDRLTIPFGMSYKTRYPFAGNEKY